MPEVMKTVGRYEILRELGRGGMAKVYLARQTDLDRFVALKELGAFHQDDESFAQRFLRESRVAGSLSHPNIVTVHDYFQHEGTPYIAMEYVERGSLRPWVGKFTLAQISGVLEGMLAGLAHAEQQDIVHRDLKPENVMVTADGRVKIADFGIAKARNKMQTGAFLTATGTTVGTPTYMAPEQAMAQDVGPWTDMYSIGVMAYEMFVGRVPFHDSDAPMAILLRHVNETIAPAHTANPSIPEDISMWIDRMLVKDVNGRTRSAQEAWDDFEGIIIDKLGPRWRREARLIDTPEQDVATPKPLTPAPFEAEAGPSTGGWGAAPTTDSDGQPLPGPATPPPGPGVSPGPDTLEQHFNQPSADSVSPADMSVEATDMLTIGGVQKQPLPQQDWSTPPPGDLAATMMPQKAGGAATATPAKKTKQDGEGRNLTPFIVGGAVLAAVVGFGGSKALGGGDGGKAKAKTVVVPLTSVPQATDFVDFKSPTGWAAAGSAPPIPNLTLDNAKAFAPAASASGAGITVGTVKNPGPHFLPEAFEKNNADALTAGQAVDLGSAKAMRYQGLRISGFPRELQLYAIPTAAGSFVIECYANSINAFAAQCESIAVTMKPKGDAQPVGLTGDPKLAGQYAQVFTALNGAVAKGNGQLKAASAAKKPKNYATAAAGLSKAYKAAQQQISGIKPARADEQKLVKSLAGSFRAAGQDYDKLAKKAKKKKPDKVAAARYVTAIGKDQSAIDAQVKALSKLGYKLGA